MILVALFTIYLLLGLTLMNIGLQWLMKNPAASTEQQRNAVIWWAWFWPYMLVRILVKKVI